MSSHSSSPLGAFSPRETEVLDLAVSDGLWRCPVATTSGGRYEVVIGSGLLRTAWQFFAEARVPHGKAVIITDASIAASHAATLATALTSMGFAVKIVPVPTGEASKNLTQAGELLSFLAANRYERRDVIVACGGGVIGDLAGFVAATYLRGVPLVQVPTTLLAMVDSSVGGKTGVNLPEGKNLVGAFYPPRLVLADLETLDTLPANEFAAGMAEVIKYGVIADAELLRELAAATDLKATRRLAQVIHRCVEIKAEVVSRDEFEITGQRASLNFGHTLGHAIENVAGYGKLLHGEAVAVGMVAAAWLSHRVLGLPESSCTFLAETLQRHGLKVRVTGLERAALWAAMGRDKKVSAGELKWVLTPSFGQVKTGVVVPEAQVEEAMAHVM